MSKNEITVQTRLLDEPFKFDFFQAVRLLEMQAPPGRSIGGSTPPMQEPVRFQGLMTLSFPPSQIAALDADTSIPRMTVTFFGLLGVVGALPRHYTELVMRHEKENRGKEVGALRAWFDLFNHRLVSLFYRAWRKYRFWPAFERGEGSALDPDTFTRCLTSLVGLGSPGLQNRLIARAEPKRYGETPRELARVDDRAIVYYGGLFGHHIHNAIALEAIVEDYFRLPVEVRQFQPQWLELTRENRSHLGEMGLNNLLGIDSVAGQRVLDVQGRICVRLGPLSLSQFRSFLPDRTATPDGKAFFRLGDLVRLYVGQEFEVDLQLVVKEDEAPECRLPKSTADGPQLGWSCWLFSQSPESDRDDPVFQATSFVV